MLCPHCAAQISDGAKFCTACGGKIEAAAPKKPALPDISAIWPEWELRRKLGKGPGSAVYQAVDRATGRRATIKIVSVPASPADVDAMLARGVTAEGAEKFYANVANDYVSNIRQMQNFEDSRNIAWVMACKVAKKTDGIGWDIYICMELLTPFSAINFGSTISEAAVIKLGIDLCEAMERYSSRQLTHCNIKPENIFIDNAGNYKLADFGSILKNRGLPSDSTRAYCAPEVEKSGQCDIRSDIYSVGMVLYSLLNAGQLPVPGRYAAPAYASSQMAQLLAQACAADPVQRFASASQLKAALISVANGTYSAAAPVAAPRQKTQATAQPKSKKGLVLIIVLAVLIAISVALICYAVVVLTRRNQPSVQEPEFEIPELTEPQPAYDTMQDFVGTYYTEAEAFLAVSGCEITYEYEFSDVVAEGCIISQNVPEGAWLSGTERVVFVVSKGEDVCPYDYSQKVVVTAGSGSSYGTLEVYEWENGEWVSLFSCDATVGKNGIGPNYGEGKKVTPEGTFKLGVALSANSISNSEWPFQRVSSDTCVVDDTDSRYYNTIQSASALPYGVHYDPIGNTLVKGYSNICIFIEHNGNGLTSDNVVAGKGSVITICGRSASIAPTLGCVDISSSNMITLMSLLDYSQNPHIEISVG